MSKINTANAALIAFALLLTCTQIPGLFAYIAELQSKSPVAATARFAFAISLTAVPAVFIPVRAFAWLLMPFLLFMPFVLVFVIQYEGFPTVSVVAAALETNRSVSAGFAHSYRHILIPAYIVIVTTYICVWLLISRKESSHLPKWAKACIAGAFVLLIALLIQRAYQDVWRHDPSFKAKPGAITQLISTRSEDTFPFGLIPVIKKYVLFRYESYKSFDARKDFRFGTARQSGSQPAAPGVYILVIGETSRAANWQLYNYERDTNPRLSQLKTIVFNDVISAATHTRESMQMALTRAEPNNLQPMHSETSLVSAFREAGLHTIWLSNQRPEGVINSTNAAISEESDTLIYVSPLKGSVAYDGEFLPHIEEALNNLTSDTLIVLHTMGSHELYRLRTPPEFKQFRPESSGDDYNFASEGIRDRLVNAYDNSILYTDHVIAEIVSLLEERSLLGGLLYFSDHGENLLDDANNRFGHGGIIPTDYVMRVPMMMWLSSKYRQAHPEKVQGVSANIGRPLSTISILSTVLDMAGLQSPKVQMKESLFESQPAQRDRFFINTNRDPRLYNTKNVVGIAPKWQQKNKRLPTRTGISPEAQGAYSGLSNISN